MDNMPAIEQAKRAIAHILNQGLENPYLGYYIGLGTQSFALLTEAAATLWGEPVEKVRKNFSNPFAKDPTKEDRQ